MRIIEVTDRDSALEYLRSKPSDHMVTLDCTASEMEREIQEDSYAGRSFVESMLTVKSRFMKWKNSRVDGQSLQSDLQQLL